MKNCTRLVWRRVHYFYIDLLQVWKYKASISEEWLHIRNVAAIFLEQLFLIECFSKKVLCIPWMSPSFTSAFKKIKKIRKFPQNYIMFATSLKNLILPNQNVVLDRVRAASKFLIFIPKSNFFKKIISYIYP